MIADVSSRPTGAAVEVTYAVDWLVWSRGYVSAAGWLVHRETPVVSVVLLLDGQRIAGTYGHRRSDVPESRRGEGPYGFVVFGPVTDARPERVTLRATLADGGTCDVELEIMVVAGATGHPRELLRVVSAPRWRARLARWLWWGQVRVARAAGLGWRARWRARGRKPMRRGAPEQPLAELVLPTLLEVLRAAQAPPLALMIDNNLGGGTTLYREQWIRRRTAAGGAVVLLYFDFHDLRYVLRYVTASCDESFSTDALDVLPLLATAVEFDDIFLNHVCSFRDPLGLVRVLQMLARGTGAPLTVAVHDYFSVCPSLNLLDWTGTFCGVPPPERCRTCLPSIRGEAHRLTPWTDIDAWRRAWALCFEVATTVLCFSHASRALLLRAYPSLDRGKCHVQPHAVDYLPASAVTVDVDHPLHIGVVGDITTAKGAAIIGEMVRIIDARRLPVDVTILGTLQAAPDSRALHVLGPYRREDLPHLIATCGANVFFMPSIWAETFSYVCEELMHLGVPVAVFDLGAPAERIAAYERGLVIDRIDADHALQRLIAFHAALQRR